MYGGKKNFIISHQGAKPGLALGLYPFLPVLAVNCDGNTTAFASNPASVLGIKKPRRRVCVSQNLGGKEHGISIHKRRNMCSEMCYHGYTTGVSGRGCKSPPSVSLLVRALLLPGDTRGS